MSKRNTWKQFSVSEHMENKKKTYAVSNT